MMICDISYTYNHLDLKKKTKATSAADRRALGPRGNPGRQIRMIYIYISLVYYIYIYDILLIKLAIFLFC